jgi:hypothetical protein
MYIKALVYFLVQHFFADKTCTGSGNRLHNEDIEALSDEEVRSPMSWITTPCSTLHNATLRVFIEISPTKNSSVESFILGVIRNTVGGSFAPNTTIPDIRRCFDKPWLLKVNNVTYAFKASFDKYTKILYHHSNLSLYQSLAIFVNDNNFKGSDQNRLFSPKSLQDLVITKGGIQIKKTFWCKQVSAFRYLLMIYTITTTQLSLCLYLRV